MGIKAAASPPLRPSVDRLPANINLPYRWTPLCIVCLFLIWILFLIFFSQRYFGSYSCTWRDKYFFPIPAAFADFELWYVVHFLPIHPTPFLLFKYSTFYLTSLTSVSLYTLIHRASNLFTSMSCIIRAGVCHIQVSYCIATVFVVGSSFALFSFGEHVNTLSDLLDFNVNHELRDVYSDYVSLMLRPPPPHCISLQLDSGTLSLSR